jgi:hypothetical protein
MSKRYIISKVFSERSHFSKIKLWPSKMDGGDELLKINDSVVLETSAVNQDEIISTRLVLLL